MLVNNIKRIFHSWGIQKEWSSTPGWSLFTDLSYLILFILKHPTWCLSYDIMSDLNLIGCSVQYPCTGCHGATTSVRVPWRFSYHIHYINSDLRHHFLIYGYGIFTSLRPTFSYLRTMSECDVFISVYSPTVSTLDSIPSFLSDFNHISNTFVRFCHSN